jgi:tetratricopeptide (TPR) repeat protein
MVSTEQTTFTRIRQLLDATERLIVVMHERQDGVIEVLHNVERMRQMLDELSGPGFDARGEENRYNALRERLIRESDKVTRLVEKSGQLHQLTNDPLWHTIHTIHTEETRRKRRKWLVVGAACTFLALLLFVVLPRVFPVPPQANTIALSTLVMQGDYQGALNRALAEQQVAPNDPLIWVWIGALQQQQNNPQAAEEAWAKGRTLYPDEPAFLSDRVGILLGVGEISTAEQDAQTLINTPDAEAIGYYHLGAIREVQQRYSEALEAFETCAQIAEQQNRPELVVTARTRIATLMQRPM